MPRPKKQHLKRRADGRYCCKYKGIQFMGDTEDEALEKREAYKRSKTITTKKTVGEYAAYWLPIHKAGVKATTYNGYASLMTRVITPISNILLTSLTTDDLAETYASLTGKSASYIAKARILLTEMFDSAVDAGLMETNPARAKSIKPPKGTRGSHRTISDEERKAINNTPHRMQIAALIMLYCGLRRGEVLGLRTEDFSDGSLTVCRSVSYISNQPVISTPKTGAGTRTVPVPEFIVKLLPKHGYVVPGKEDKPMTLMAFQRGWESYQKAIGHTIRPHDLRHSYCTWLRDSGVEIHQAIIWMGHADETMVLRIYDHPGANREAEARDKLFSSLRMQNGMQTQQAPLIIKTKLRST